MDTTYDDGLPKPGTRVRVMNADQSKDLGLGTYLGVVPMKDIPDEPPPACVALPPLELTPDERAVVDEMVEQLEEDMEDVTPKIKLDSGEIVYGFQCWWHEVDENGDDITLDMQHWHCERCNVTGFVCHDLSADVQTVVRMIEDDHRNASPQCDQPVERIRAINSRRLN